MTAAHDDAAIENLIIRYKDLDTRQSSFRPRDMLIPRFDRERFSVIGRPGEGTASDKAAGAVSAFSVVYVRCGPGKGIARHAHDSSEVFIILSGSWELSCGEMTTRIEPFDVVSVPPQAMHGLVNVSNETGVAMAINEGKTGVPIQLAPEVLAELRSMGHVLSDVEHPPSEVAS